MKPIHLVTLILVAVAVMLGITMMKKKQEQSAPKVAASSGPPAGATFVDVEKAPLDVIMSGNMYVGQWIKEPGWQVAIKEITKSSDGGKALRIEVSQPSTLRGSAWIVAVVPEDTDIKVNQFVMLSGRIDEIREFNDGGPIPGRTLVVRDAKLTRL
ncbi:MAG TPA: hypothetical protein VD997_01230 [Phycisphaerales bacterium]|nr:hypothetical protein [Phycisphaerales bacterium]